MVQLSALDAFGQAGAKRGANPESSRGADGYFGHRQLRHRLDHSDTPLALLCFVNNQPITFCDQPCLLFLFSFDLQILINTPIPFLKACYPLSSGLEFRLVNSLPSNLQLYAMLSP